MTLTYPRCAACGVTEIPVLDGLPLDNDCPRCGENAIVCSPGQHADYDRERAAEDRDV